MDDDRSEFSDLINSDFFTELEKENYNYISPFRRIYRIKTMIFAPADGEKCFEKNVNSSFHVMTGLTKYLISKNEKDIITVGVSTDYCLDATVKSGFEQGFHIIVPAYANSTYDNPYFDGETAYKYYNEFMWSVRYAQTVSVEETIDMMSRERIINDD